MPRQAAVKVDLGNLSGKFLNILCVETLGKSPVRKQVFIGLWHFLNEYINFMKFHQYLLSFASEYHPKIQFDHSHYQKIHSQCQNHCLKNFLIFDKKEVLQSSRKGGKGGGGSKSHVGNVCPNEHVFSY